MKLIKYALVGGMSFGCATQSAWADDLNSAANASRGLLPGPAQTGAISDMPAGYDLVTIDRTAAYVWPGFQPGRHDGKTVTVLSIKPSADAPPTATIEWSGYVQTGIVLGKGSLK